MKRRQFVTGSLLSAAVASQALAQEAQPSVSTETEVHTFEKVVQLAQTLAKSAHKSQRLEMSGVFKELSYDQYRGIRFRKSADPLKGNSLFSMDLLPPGRFYQDRVRIAIVEQGEVRELGFDPTMLDFDSALFVKDNLNLDAEQIAALSWSGFRLRFPINAEEVQDEFLVFQGASYFRAVARDTLYGLSARGLALKTGDAEGEEFPYFSRFWIYQPQAGEQSIQIDALLESKSITGAYHFEITPGSPTVCTVTMQLFPRVEIKKYGIAPLTSMYYFSPTRRYHVDDYRNAVHDNDGLAMHTGMGARLWRPLANPKTLQYSAFMDNNPKGFGFLQRARQFEDYQDAEAQYEKRPSAWVEPLGEWGKGNVSLIEIPTDSEFNDNIIAFWNGAEALKAGESYSFAYRLLWSQTGPRYRNRAVVYASRMGKSVNDPSAYTVVIDYQFAQALAVENMQFAVNATRGVVSSSHVLRLANGLVRASFDYRPDKQNAELQAALSLDGDSVSETWLYRWTV